MKANGRPSVADDLPPGVRTLQGNLGEMAANFEGWDPALNMIISCLKSALKWKLLHFKELDQWTKVWLAYVEAPVKLTEEFRERLLSLVTHRTLLFHTRVKEPQWLWR